MKVLILLCISLFVGVAVAETRQYEIFVDKITGFSMLRYVERNNQGQFISQPETLTRCQSHWHAYLLASGAFSNASRGELTNNIVRLCNNKVEMVDVLITLGFPEPRDGDTACQAATRAFTSIWSTALGIVAQRGA